MAYGDLATMISTQHEDLLDFIADVSPDDNPLSTLFGTTSASNQVHSWTEDYQGRPSSVPSSVEGADATFADLVNPTRRSNVAQIITQTFKVSGSAKAANVAGMSDMYAYQAAKASKIWKNGLEYSLLRASLTSGASGTAAQMAGIQATVTSHYTNLNSGTSLSEEHLNSMVLGVASDVGNDQLFDMLVLPLALRQKVSTFTAGATKNVDASDKRLTRPVAVYESDFNVIRIFPHKDVVASAATPGPMVLGLREDSWKIAYYRKPFRKELPENGDYSTGEIIGEATLEFRAERANARSSGFNTTG